MRFRYIVLIIALLIFLLTILVYTPTLKNDFVNWDDDIYVYENNTIHSLNPRSFLWMLTAFHSGNWHPLTWLSHAADYAIWGRNPFGHHLTSIILHGLNSSLVFILVIQLVLVAGKISALPSASPPFHSTSVQSLIAAGVTALLFGVHPLHVESVAWVAERKDVLCALFFLLSLLCYLSYTASVATKNQRMWYSLCLILFIFALMSKPMAVTLPIILVLLDTYPLQRLRYHSSKVLFVLGGKIPFLAASIFSCIITIMAQHSGGALRNLEQLNLGTRLLNALRVLIFYLENMLVPVKLVAFYPVSKHIRWYDLPYLSSALLVVGITGACVWVTKRGNKLFLVAWTYYIVTLLPVLGIIKVGDQAAADRYTYLPSISVFLLVGVGAAWLWKKIDHARVKILCRVVFLLCVCVMGYFLSYLTIRQIRMWQDSESVWNSVITLFPDRVPVAYNNLGRAYLSKKMVDEAIAEFKKALTISPHYLDGHYNLSLAYDRKGMLDEAIAENLKAIAINPNDAEAHNNLGVIYEKKGMHEKAITEYRKAIAINPRLKQAHLNLKRIQSIEMSLEKATPREAETFFTLGSEYAKKSMWNEAESAYRKALDINPNYERAYINLGNVYLSKGEIDKALIAYEKTLSLNPQHANAHKNLALALYATGNYKLAITHYDKAIELGVSPDQNFLDILKPHR
jgi:tetratricopeptide (TPR) repeat protein